MIFFEDPNSLEVCVQKAFLNQHKWEFVISNIPDGIHGTYSFVDINAIAKIFEIDVSTFIDNAKEYNGVYYEKNSINSYNALLFDEKKDCKKFIENYINALLLLSSLQKS